MLKRENCTPAELARQRGVSCARVTQIVRLLWLTPAPPALPDGPLRDLDPGKPLTLYRNPS
jgi:hypothetical protein